MSGPSLSLWNDALASTPTDRKVALTMELEKLAAAGDRRVRVESATTAMCSPKGAVATSTGIRSVGRETGRYLSVSTLATQGDETQTGFGFSVGRCLDDLDPAVPLADGLHRATPARSVPPSPAAAGSPSSSIRS